MIGNMAAKTQMQFPIASFSYLVIIYFYNIFIARALYSKLSVQLSVSSYTTAIQITRAPAAYEERSRGISRPGPGPARNGPSPSLSGAVRSKSDNFAVQLRYRAWKARDGGERGELIPERERSRGSGRGLKTSSGGAWRSVGTRPWIVPV